MTHPMVLPRRTAAFCWFVATLLLVGGVSSSQAQTFKSGSHKVQVSTAAAAARVEAAGGQLIADYGGFKLYNVPSNAPRALITPAALDDKDEDGIEVRDGYDTIRLNAVPIDTASPMAAAARAVAVKVTPGSFTGRKLHLVHFVGPVKPESGWTVVQAGIAGAAGSTTVSDTPAAGVSRKFYRVRLELP